MNEFLNKFKFTSDEFTPIPFWFLNDAPDEAEIRRQLIDFRSKGVDAAVLHPRLGLPDGMTYLSDEYFRMIGMCLENMASLGMKAVLYDEGMYPSGSAGGLVAASDPRFASRALIEKPYDKLSREEHDELTAVYAVKLSGGELLSFRRIAEEDHAAKDELKLAYFCGYSGGRIRGLHASEDDGKPDAPLSGDILGKKAVERFISLTHGEYYRRFGKYFGGVIIGFFTDEPCPLGRGAENKISWTEDFPDEGICHPALFHDGYESQSSKKLHDETERKLLAENFYGQLHDWCASHGISLMGHPSRSGELFAEQRFDIPGQDIVWRGVSPENSEGGDAVYARCSSDAALIYGKRRCSVEAFGVCGRRGNPWDFTASEMYWHLNYMFARGVNLIIPHAFYYSLRTPLQSGERPPDVGPNSSWWQDYAGISDYIKRMCRLNCDSEPVFDVGILVDGEITGKDGAAARLFEENLICCGFAELELCRVENGRLKCGGAEYSTLLLSEDLEYRDGDVLSGLLGQCESEKIKVIREAAEFISTFEHRDFRFDGVTKGKLRVSRLRKDGCEALILANENGVTEDTVSGTLRIRTDDTTLLLDPYTGEICGKATPVDGFCSIKLSIEPYQLIVAASGKFESIPDFPEYESDGFIDLDHMSVELFGSYTPLSSDGDFALEIKPGEKYVLKADELHDAASVTIDRKYAGMLTRKPYSLDITSYLDEKTRTHRISVSVIPSSANLYGRPVDCAIYGLGIKKYKIKSEKAHE